MSHGVVKIVNKARYWWRHGKHAQIDPVLLNPPKSERPAPEMYESIGELMAQEGKGRHKKGKERGR